MCGWDFLRRCEEVLLLKDDAAIPFIRYHAGDQKGWSKHPEVRWYFSLWKREIKEGFFPSIAMRCTPKAADVAFEKGKCALWSKKMSDRMCACQQLVASSFGVTV